MNWKPWREIAAVVAFLMVATWLIAASGADLSVSSRFYIGGRWPVGDLFPWQTLYRMDRIPAILLAASSVLLALYSLKERSYRAWRKQCLFLVTLLIIGPGILVNTCFKGHWGRPRPHEIVQFGGKKQFLQPWQKGLAGEGRSFPSGHSSAAFYLTAPYFIHRRNRPGAARIWLAGGLAFGIIMSIARIVQGGHFLSDTLWAWGMVHLIAIALYYLLRLDRVETPSAAL